MRNNHEAIVDLMNKIHRSERSLYRTLEKLVRNEKFADSRPMTHKFFTNLHSFYITRGFLTDNQKRALNTELYKQAEFLLTLNEQRIAENADVPEMSEAEERSAIMSENAPF